MFRRSPPDRNHRRLNRKGTRGMAWKGRRRQPESLEPRLLLAADLAYPTDPLDSLVTDVTLIADATGNTPLLTLYQTGTNHALASVPLNDPSDVEVNITRGMLPEAFGDTLRIDLESFESLNSFVTSHGGVLTISFEGGIEVPVIADDHLVLENGLSTALDYTLDISSSSDIAAQGLNLELNGSLRLLSADTIDISNSTISASAAIELTAADSRIGESDALDPSQVVALPTVGIALDGVEFKSDSIHLLAEAEVDIAIELADALDGGLSFGGIVTTASADIAINASSLAAENDLSVVARSNVTTLLERAPEEDGDEQDDDQSQDAAIAGSVIDSSSSIDIAGQSTVVGGGTVLLTSENLVHASTVADGTTGTGDAGGVVATTIVTGETSLDVHESSTITSGGDLTMEARSDRTVVTSALATSQGATEDGDVGTSTTGQQTLSENDAETSDGGVTLAATVAVSSLSGDTRALVDNANLTSSTGEIVIRALADHHVTTESNASTTSGSEGTGVGVGVGIGRVRSNADARIAGSSQLSATHVRVVGRVEQGTVETEAVSGPSGDADGADVGVAGALVINANVANATATIASDSHIGLFGGHLTLDADSVTNSTANARPLETPSGESLGVGASVAIHIADHTTRAALDDNSSVINARNVNITANAAQQVTTNAIGAAAGGTAVAGVVSLVVANQDTVAEIGDGNSLNITGSLTVEADHTATTTTDAQGDAEGTETAAIGAALALNFVDQRTEARVAREVSATQALSILANDDSSTTSTATASAQGTSGDSGSDPDTDAQNAAQRGAADSAATSAGARTSGDAESTPSASTSDGTVSVAAAVGVNVVETITRAAIEGTHTIHAGTLLRVESSANTDATVTADGAATGGESAGVGAAVAINRASAVNHAIIDPNVTLDASGLAVRALMRNVDGNVVHNFAASSTAGAGDTDVGIAGSVALNLVDTNTLASVGSDSSVTIHGGLLAIEAAAATEQSSSATPEGDGGEGSDVGVGASLALNRTDHLVHAEVVDGANLSGTAAQISLLATGLHATTTNAQNGAAGDVAVGAAVAVVIVDHDTHAYLGSGTGLHSNGDVQVLATHLSAVATTVGADAAGADVGIGASVAINDVHEDNSARVARDLTASGDMSVVSNAQIQSTIDAQASAGGADSGGNDADAEADKQRNSNPNNGGNSLLPSASDESSNANSSATSESSTGSGGVGVAAVVAVNVMHVNNTAAVENGVEISSNGALRLQGIIQVDADVRATGTAVTVNEDDNVAAAVALNVSHVANHASASDAAMLTGNSIRVEALTADEQRNDFVVWGAAAAGGTGDIGGAGSVAINIVDFENLANAGAGSTLVARNTIDVGADNDLNIQTLAAGGGFSQDTAVGASVAVNSVTANTRARLLGDADARGAIQVTAATRIVPTTMDLPLLNDGQDPAATSLAVAGAASTGDVSLAAAAAINIFHLATEATIGDSSAINQNPQGVPTAAQSVTVSAEDVTELTSFTGALGVSFGSFGLGAGLDLGILTKETTATIGQGAVVTAQGAIAVDATSNEEIITLSTNLGLSDGVGIAGSASVYVINTSTLSSVGHGADITSGGAIGVQSTGTFELTAVAGALAFGSNAGIGASNVTLTHHDDVSAAVGDDASMSSGGVDGISVAANSQESIIGTTAAGGLSSSAAVAGSATVLILEETTRASIGNGAVLEADNGAVAGEADVRVTAEGETQIVSVAGSLAAAGDVAVGLGADVGRIIKVTEAHIGSGVQAEVEGEIYVLADALEDITSVGAGISASGGVSVALDAAVHVMDLTTRAWIGDDPSDAVPTSGPGNIHARGSIVVAADDRTEIDKVVGVLAAASYAGIGAAAGVSTINKRTEAFIGDGAVVAADGNTAGIEVRTGEFDISYAAASLDTPGIEAEGDVSIDSDTGTLSAQGEVGLADLEEMDVDQQGGSEANDPSLTGQRTLTHRIQSNFRGLSITATNRDDIETYTVSFGAGVAGVAISAGVNVVSADTRAWIGANAVVESLPGSHAAQSVNVAAGSDFAHFALAGSIAVGGFGFAPAVAATVLRNSTEAFTGNGAQVAANNDVAVAAYGTEDILLVGVGFAAGPSAAFGGAVDVLIIDNTVTSYLGASSLTFAGGDIFVGAEGMSDIDVIAGAAAGALVGGAGSVGVISLTKETTAFIGANATVDGRGVGAGVTGVLNGDMAGDGDSFSTITGHGVIVQAQSSEDILHIAAAAGAGYVGVAGGVAVTLIDSDTNAFIDEDVQVNQTDGNAGADADQSLFVNASNHVNAFAFAGSLAAGLGALSGAVNVGSLKNDTAAEVRDGVTVTAEQDVEINAVGIKDLQGYTFSFAPGLVALSGSVSVWSIGTALEKTYSNSDGDSANALIGDSGVSTESADENAAGQASDAMDQPVGMLGNYEDDNANPNNSSSKQVGTITGLAASSVDSSAPSQLDIINAINSGGTEAGTTARIAPGALIHAGADIQVGANENMSMIMTIGGFSGAVGGSVGVLQTAANAAAHADGTLTSDTGDVIVSATLDQDVVVTSLSGQSGYVGLGAAVIVVNDQSTVQATIGSVVNANLVQVVADADQVMDVTTGQLQGGLLAAGASFTRITADGETRAEVLDNAQLGQQAGSSVQSLQLVAESRLDVDDSTVAIAAGGVAVSANFAFVDVSPRIEAAVGQGADIDVLDDVSIEAVADIDIDAEVLTAVGGASAVGASLVSATMDAEILATVGLAVTISAGNGIIVESRKNHDGVAALPNRGVRARADAPSFSLNLSGTGTIPTATETSLVRSRVGAGAELIAGNGATDDITIRALSAADAEARGFSLSLGLGQSYGATLASSIIEDQTQAILDGSASGGGDLRVIATETSNADADADAASGGITAGATGARSRAWVQPELQASIGGGGGLQVIDMGQDITVRATSTGDADADTFGLSVSVLGAAFGIMIADAQMTPELDTYVNGNVQVNAGNSIELRSAHNANGEGETHASADAPGAGVVAGNGTIVTSQARADVDTRIMAGAQLNAGGDVTIASDSTNFASAEGTALTAGAVASLGVVTTEAIASGATRARMDGAIAGANFVSIVAHADEIADAHSQAVNGGGFGAGAAALARAISGDSAVSSDMIQASIGDGGTVTANDHVALEAVGVGSATAEAEGVSVAGAVAFGIGVGQAEIDTQVRSFVGDDTTLEVGGLDIAARFNTSASFVPNGNEALATSWSAAGALGGALSLISAPALASADTQAWVGQGSTINAAGHAIEITAQSSNRARSVPNNVSLGGLGSFGVTDSVSTVDGVTRAHLDGSVVGGGAGGVGATTITVQSQSESIAPAEAFAASVSGLAAGQATTATSIVNPTVEAYFGGNQTVRTTSDVNIVAEAITDATAEAHGIAVAGGIAVGGSTAAAQLTPHVMAGIEDGANLAVFPGDVSVLATHNHGLTENGATAIATASSGGFIAGSGASANATTELDVDAYILGNIDNRGSIFNRASSNNRSLATAAGLGGGGLVGVGATIANASVGGTQQSYLGDGVIIRTSANLEVRNDADHNAVSDVRSLSLGLGGAVDTNAAASTIDPSILTSLGDAGRISADQAVIFRGISLADASATTQGVAVAGGGAYGASDAQAHITPTISTMLGNSSVIGGEGIQVIALHNGSEAGPGAGRARAESHSSSGALVIGLAGATATAESSAEVTASVANGTSVVDARFGTLDVIAGANNESYSTADGIALGGVAGIGVSAASATSSGSTIARIEPLGVIRGAGVNVNSATRDIAISQSEAAAGGLLAAGNGAVALSHVEPFILAELQHDVDIEVMGTVEVATESATEGDAVARGISLAGGVSGGASLSSATIAPTIAAQIGNGVSIAAGESIEIFATHNDKVTPYNGSFNGNADVNTAANQIELPGAHGLSTGDRVTYVDGGGATIGGLVDGQSYAVIVVDDNTVRLGQVFDATTQVSSVTDAITFNIAHGFTNGQRVIYGNNGNTSISGLNAGSAYFVHVVNDFTIKLYSSLAEATAPDETFTIVDVNGPSDTIDLTGNPFTEGEAVTYFGPESLPFAGAAVNAQGLPDNSITFQDFGVGDGDMGGGGHGFANGEHISYRADDAEVVGGLVDGGDYYVVVIDVNTIQLASDPELSNIIALTSPDDPDDADDEPSLHYLSRYQEVPLGNLQDGRTYYVHLVDPMSDPNIIQLRETPGGSAVNLITANTTGTHRLRQAGVQLNPAGTSGVHTLAADLTALGNGVQRLIGAGGALGVASASVNGVSAANAVGSGGALFGSFRLSQGEVHVDADVSASTGTNVTLEAAEDVRVETRSSINSAGVGRVFSGAFVGIGTARADVQISHDAASSIGAGSEVRAGRNIVISTETNHDATGNTRAVGGGGIAAATADTNVDILHSTLVDIGNGAELHADGNVDLFSEAEFGGNLIAEASSGGLAIRPDTETRYAVGDSDTDLEDTVIRIGANAVVAAEDTTTMTAQVDNDGRIDLRSESNAYGVVADTNADANIAIRSRAQIEVESGATILGREAILATAQHEPLNVYTSAIADGKALSDSDAHVRFSPLTESYVIGADNATWISHDLTVRAEVHENQFGYSWRYFGAWPVSDGGATLTWRSDREIIFDSDVVLLSRDAELIVDAFGVVTSARGVTVNGGQGEGYLVPGASFSVDPIVNNTPGHALFETNILESEPGVLFANRGGAVRGSTPGVTRGVVYVRHTIDQIDIQNHTGKHMTINGIAPIDRDGNPAANVDIHSREISLEFDIAHRFEETDIHIETTSTGDADIRLDGVIDNPIGTTSIVNHAGDITRVPEGVVSDQLIRTNVLSMNAPGSVGAFGNSVTDLRIHIDLVQSLGRPEDLQVVAGEDIVLDLRGVRRQSSLSPFQVDISNLTAGGTVDVFVRKAIEESVLIGVPAYDLFVDTDVYTSNPPGDFFERHYTPDQPGGAIIQGGVVGVFGGNAVEIPATYHFDYVEGQQVHIFSVAQDDCIDINATIVLVDDGPGVIDLLGPGDITLNVPSGDAPIGQIQSLLGNVSVTAVGSIVNGGSSTLPNVIGVRVTLASQQGEVGRTRFPLRVDSAPSIAGGLNVEAELGIHVAETAGLLRLGSVITRSGSVVITSAGGLLGDFNQDGVLTTLDVDALVRQLSGTRPILSYDTTGDAIVDFDDLADWVRNLKKTEFGDVNLDFVVDGEDLNVITRNLFARDTVWSSGNLDGHSGTDVRDFNLWNTHKFQQVQSRIQPAKAPPRAALATAESAGHDQHFAALHSAAEALGSDSTKLARWRQQSQRRRQAGEFAGEYLQSVDSLFAGW